MKKNIFLGCAVLLFAFGCRKAAEEVAGNAVNTPSTAEQKAAAAAACAPGYYNLALDPSGKSVIYKVSGTPSLGPVIVTPINGSAGNNIIGSATIPGGVLKMTGLSYDPTLGLFWGVTGTGGNFPNSLIKFYASDVNVVGITPLTAACGISLEVSDIERDFTTGQYYALNWAASPNSRVVKITAPGGVVSCLPNVLGAGVQPRGLTFGCNAQLYVMHMSGPNGKVLNVNKATGLITATYTYPGVISPGAPAGSAPEMGLHMDCSCNGKFVTGSFSPAASLLHTDGLPAGLGGPVYASLAGTLKPTVDFARP